MPGISNAASSNSSSSSIDSAATCGLYQLLCGGSIQWCLDSSQNGFCAISSRNTVWNIEVSLRSSAARVCVAACARLQLKQPEALWSHHLHYISLYKISLV
jgi:hypothetical protein